MRASAAQKDSPRFHVSREKTAVLIGFQIYEAGATFAWGQQCCLSICICFGRVWQISRSDTVTRALSTLVVISKPSQSWTIFRFNHISSTFHSKLVGQLVIEPKKIRLHFTSVFKSSQTKTKNASFNESLFRQCWFIKHSSEEEHAAATIAYLVMELVAGR